MFVPKYLPQMGAAVNPLFRSTVRGAYKIGQKTREMVAEAQEQVHDIVAEVHAEGDLDATEKRAPSPAHRAPERGRGAAIAVSSAAHRALTGLSSGQRREASQRSIFS